MPPHSDCCRMSRLEEVVLESWFHTPVYPSYGVFLVTGTVWEA